MWSSVTPVEGYSQIGFLSLHEPHNRQPGLDGHVISTLSVEIPGVQSNRPFSPLPCVYPATKLEVLHKAACHPASLHSTPPDQSTTYLTATASGFPCSVHDSKLEKGPV